MAINPFTIDTGSQFVSQGLGNVASAIAQGRAESRQLERQQAIQDEAAKVIEGGNISEMSQFMARNPQFAQAIERAWNFKDQVSKDNAVQSSFRILRGEDPQTVLQERAQFITERGGDPTQTIQALGDTPEQIERGAKLMLAEFGTPAQIAAIESLSRKEDAELGRITKDREAQIKRELELDKTIFDRSKKLRDEYSSKSKEFVKVRDAYDRVLASAEDPDSAGDIALIFNYMKMLDPGSVVREGEFATAQNAGSIATSVRNLYNKARSGERLSESQRKMFQGRSEKLFKKAEDRNKKVRDSILRIGKEYDLTESNIFGGSVPEDEIAQQEAATQSYQEGQTARNPQTGEIIVFRGGQWQPM